MPIEFRCPHCGAQASAADSSAGEAGVCSGCGKTLTIPPRGPDTNDRAAKRTNWPTILIAVLVPVALLVLLLFPAVNSVRGPTRPGRCITNLSQISNAMFCYELDHNSFPPAYVADKNGRRMHSWRVLLLPYLDCKDLYKEYHFDEPWDGPHNRALADRMPEVYCCPDAPSTSVTSYAVVVGPNTVFPGAKAVRMNEITDGLSNTILVVESAKAGINWLEPRDLNEDRMRFKINGDPNTEIGSFHLHGANIVFCDGASVFFQDSINAEALKDLIERNDGHRVDMGQLFQPSPPAPLPRAGEGRKLP
jgi:hypothetical protein